MSNIISIHCLLQFLIFISILPISLTIESKLEFVFLNGFNVIRCSDQQVQVYSTTDKVLSQILTCDNKDEIYTNLNAGFMWNKLQLICSEDDSKVQEEQIITLKHHGKKYEQLPTIKGQLGQLEKPYEFQVDHDHATKEDKILSSEQPADESYFNQNADVKERRIYIWFPGHASICRIVFTSAETNPCPSMNNQEVSDVNYACYYNPGADVEPTIEEMEAELEQIEQASKPADTNAFVLDLEKPNISVPDSGGKPSADTDPSSTPNSPGSKPSSHVVKANKTAPDHSPKLNQEKSMSKTIGVIIGILLLIALIGGVAFYMIRKHRLDKSSSASSTNIEDGNNEGASYLAPNENQQSLPVASANDANTELSMNVSSKKGKPTVELQAHTANKRQRTGTSMVFNEDL